MISGNQQVKRRDTWRAMLQKAPVFALPVALALLISGSIWFVAAQYHLGIKHPSWPFWIVLGVIVVQRLLRAGVLRHAPHALDIAVLTFLAVVTLSLSFKGLGSQKQAAIYLSTFIGLPYLAGRLMAEFEITIFLRATFIIAGLSLPLLMVGLALLPETDLFDDRIKELFGAYYINNYVGLTVGALVVLLIAGFVGPYEATWRRYKALGLSMLALALWILIFVAARGGLVAALIVSGVTLLCGKWVSVRRRSEMLLFVVAVIGVSGLTLPTERVRFMKEMQTIGAVPSGAVPSGAVPSGAVPSGAVPSGAVPSGVAPSGAAPSGAAPCQIKGNSPATRILYFREAFRLFLTVPVWGIGAGNFGYISCVQAAEFASPHSSLLHAFSELGVIGGSAFLAISIIIFAGLARIVISQDNAGFRGLAWFMLTLWLFFFLLDQISGNYFTSYQFYGVTGVAAGVLAASRVKRKYVENNSPTGLTRQLPER